jgi:hypothetical protein
VDSCADLPKTKVQIKHLYLLDKGLQQALEWVYGQEVRRERGWRRKGKDLGRQKQVAH